MNNFKTMMIWCLINKTYHPQQKEEEKQISAYMPLINVLFPGMNYYSISGFMQVNQSYLTPTLTKLFPELVGMPEDQVSPTEEVTIEKPFLACNGYEHQDNPKWKETFDEMLQAA